MRGRTSPPLDEAAAAAAGAGADRLPADAAGGSAAGGMAATGGSCWRGVEGQAARQGQSLIDRRRWAVGGEWGGLGWRRRRRAARGAGGQADPCSKHRARAELPFSIQVHGAPSAFLLMHSNAQTAAPLLCSALLSAHSASSQWSVVTRCAHRSPTHKPFAPAPPPRLSG